MDFEPHCRAGVLAPAPAGLTSEPGARRAELAVPAVPPQAHGLALLPSCCRPHVRPQGSPRQVRAWPRRRDSSTSAPWMCRPERASVAHGILLGFQSGSHQAGMGRSRDDRTPWALAWGFGQDSCFPEPVPSSAVSRHLRLQHWAALSARGPAAGCLPDALWARSWGEPGSSLGFLRHPSSLLTFQPWFGLST